MEIKASAKFVKTTPDKARILSGLVVGKATDVAIAQLTFCGRDAGKFIILVIKQAMDQVKSKGLEMNDFVIKNFVVNEGPKLKRRRIRHQGRSTAILKRMAHIEIVLTNNKLETLNSKPASPASLAESRRADRSETKDKSYKITKSKKVNKSLEIGATHGSKS